MVFARHWKITIPLEAHSNATLTGFHRRIEYAQQGVVSPSRRRSRRATPRFRFARRKITGPIVNRFTSMG
jgi:hypothetical protein